MPLIGVANIQGTTDGEITPELVLNIGKTIGTQYKSITIARDLRPTSMMVRSSLIAGLTAAGASIHDAGIAPSPVLPFASKGTECCIMISSPDNRDCISGLRFWNTDGTFFTDSQMFAFSSRFEKEEKILPSFKSIGNVRYVTGSIDNYRAKVAKEVGAADCQVILDCASDCASLVAPQLITDIGADALTVNCHSDGRSPGRSPSLEEINLKILSKVVKANYGSIGIALNGDGGRIAAIDEDGRYVNGATLLALFIKFFQPKSIAVPADTTMAVKDLMKDNIIITKLGAHHVGESIKANNLDAGGCEDGSFFFSKISYAPDGIAAAAYLSKIASESSLRDVIDELPTYWRENTSLRYSEDRDSIAKRIGMKISDINYTYLCEVDGWRVEMESGWFLIRFSDNDSVIDITVEGRDKAYTIGLMEIAKLAVTSSLKPVNI